MPRRSRTRSASCRRRCSQLAKSEQALANRVRSLGSATSGFVSRPPCTGLSIRSNTTRDSLYSLKRLCVIDECSKDKRDECHEPT